METKTVLAVKVSSLGKVSKFLSPTEFDVLLAERCSFSRASMEFYFWYRIICLLNKMFPFNQHGNSVSVWVISFSDHVLCDCGNDMVMEDVLMEMVIKTLSPLKKTAS